MTDIVTDIRRNLAGPEHHPLMYSPPLRTAQVQELLAVIDALADDKRSLMRIVDDLSAQVNALNQMLQGVVKAQNANGVLAQWTRVEATPGTVDWEPPA